MGNAKSSCLFTSRGTCPHQPPTPPLLLPEGWSRSVSRKSPAFAVSQAVPKPGALSPNHDERSLLTNLVLGPLQRRLRNQQARQDGIRVARLRLHVAHGSPVEASIVGTTTLVASSQKLYDCPCTDFLAAPERIFRTLGSSYRAVLPETKAQAWWGARWLFGPLCQGVSGRQRAGFGSLIVEARVLLPLCILELPLRYCGTISCTTLQVFPSG